VPGQCRAELAEVQLARSLFSLARTAAVTCGVPHVGHPPGEMTPSQPSARAAPARDKLMRAAERLYAELGFAKVSVRQIGEAAGQRNKSAVQYHFTSRDELIKAILARHAAAIEKHRIAMVAERPCWVITSGASAPRAAVGTHLATPGLRAYLSGRPQLRATARTSLTNVPGCSHAAK
jgi:AcrR family transcriptional regulator